MSDVESWSELISRIRLRLIQCARNPGQAKEGIYDALEDLEKLDRLLRGPGPGGAISGRRNWSGGPRFGHNQYRIEQSKRGPCLAELFAADKPPFRCDKKTYDSMAAVLAEQDEPLPVDELARLVRKVTRPDLPDYLVRECIRFWISRDPPLVKKVGTRYGAVNLAGFRADARKAWTGLETMP